MHLRNPDSVIGLLYVPAQPMAAVELPADAIAAVPVPQSDLTTAQQVGTYRVLIRLGRRERYFPFPPWGARDGPPGAPPGADAESLLGRMPRSGSHRSPSSFVTTLWRWASPGPKPRSSRASWRRFGPVQRSRFSEARAGRECGAGLVPWPAGARSHLGARFGRLSTERSPSHRRDPAWRVPAHHHGGWIRRRLQSFLVGRLHCCALEPWLLQAPTHRGRPRVRARLDASLNLRVLARHRKRKLTVAGLRVAWATGSRVPGTGGRSRRC